jgi:phosphoglycolate phosphatase-like HAD superfamily hydrolase
MSIFDRFRDIANFLNTRPESRTPEQEQIGEELSEAEKTARDIAESRLEGVSDEEARDLSDLIRDFFKSDDQGIKKFREKNKDQIAKDKKLVSNILKRTPVGALRDFVVRTAVNKYGPQIAETASTFLSSFLPDDKKKSQFEFMGTIYDLNDFFEAGRVDFTGEKSYEIDKDRRRVSALKAYINLLPDDFQKNAGELYTNLRQAKSLYENTPFGDFLSAAELKESGLESILLGNKDRVFTKQELVDILNNPGLDSQVTKVRYARDDENRLSNTDLYIKSLKELNDQLTNLYDRRFLREGVLMPMQDDLVNIIQLTNEQFGQDEMENERYIQLISAANQNFQEMATKFRDEKAQKNFGMNYNSLQLKYLEDEARINDLPLGSPEYNEAYRDIQLFKSFDKQFDVLFQTINQNLEVPASGDAQDQNLLSFLERSGPSYRTTGPAGIENYDVQGITVALREGALGESAKASTHFDGSWTDTKSHDTFHYRTGVLTDPSGVKYNTLVEVQSDDEGLIRRENQYYDPSLKIQQDRIRQELTDFANNDLQNFKRIFKVTPDESSAITDILAAAQRGSDIFVPASSDIVKEGIFDRFGGQEATMIDNIPDANRENYLNNNDRAAELFKYAKKLNKYLENLYRDDKISRENQEGKVSKTLPYVATGPLGYAEESIYQFVLDSIRTGVDKVQWIPGEHSAQIQLGGQNNPTGGVDFSSAATTLAQFNDERSQKRAQGHLNFYGSDENPKNNTMYKAATNVVNKINKLGQQIYGEDFVPPTLYEQGAKNDEGEFFNTYVVNPDELRGKSGYISNVKQGWGFIDLAPTIEYLKSKNYDNPAKELDEGLLQNYVSRKSGGQVWSSSLLSLDEVING